VELLNQKVDLEHVGSDIVDLYWAYVNVIVIICTLMYNLFEDNLGIKV